jgi:hypothetical protein
LSGDFSSSSSRKQVKLNINKVKEIVMQSVQKHVQNNAVFYIDESIYPKGTEFTIGTNRYQMPSDTIMVFVDEEPGKNWGHNCRYLFFDVNSGQVTGVREQFPPSLTKIPQTFKVIWKPNEVPDWALLTLP